MTSEFIICRLMKKRYLEAPGYYTSGVSLIEVGGPYPYAEAVRKARAILQNKGIVDKALLLYNNNSGKMTLVYAGGARKMEPDRYYRTFRNRPFLMRGNDGVSVPSSLNNTVIEQVW